MRKEYSCQCAGSCRRLTRKSRARGLGRPVYFTIRIFREIRENIVISLWFGIVGSLCGNYAELCVFSGRVYTRIDYLLVLETRNAPIDLRIVQDMIPKASLPPT